MGVTVAVARAAANLATGTQNITTTDLGGLTPKAALIIVTYATADGTAADHAVLSYGACDGTNQFALYQSAEHGQDTTDTSNGRSTSRLINILVPGASAADCIASFSAFITNGITINWTDAPDGSRAYLIHVLFYAGTDVSASVGNIASVGNTVDSKTDKTGVGFNADLLHTGMSINDISGNHTWHSFGIVHNGVSITQRCYVSNYGHNLATTNSVCQGRNDSGIMQCVWNTGALDWYGEFSAFNADGFSITTRNDGGNNLPVDYLALDFNGAANIWLGTHTTPTSTGNNSVTAPGFTPQAVFMFCSLIEAANTAYTDDHGGSFGFSMFDANDSFCATISDEDNADVSNSQSLSDDVAIALPDDDGLLEAVAAFVSFDANGWTLNYTTAPSVAKLFWALAIGEKAVTGYTITAAQGSYTYTGQTSGTLAGRKITADQGLYSYTGFAAGLLRGLGITADYGSYALAGQASGFLIGRLLAAAQGDYSLSGLDTGLLFGRLLAASQGSYTLAGQDAGLLAARLIGAAQGSYALTGQDINLLIARLIAAAQGNYTLTGISVTLIYTPTEGYIITADMGSYSLSSQASSLLVNRIINAAVGNYILSGKDAGILRGFQLGAVQGSYTLTGQAATFVVNRMLAAAQGSYLLTGQMAEIGLFGIVPDWRILSINYEDRDLAIKWEDRTMAVKDDD